MRPPSSSRIRLLSCVILLLILAASNWAYAQTTAWTGAVDNNWNNALNWTGGIPVGSGTANVGCGTPCPGAVATGSANLLSATTGNIAQLYLGLGFNSNGTVVVDGALTAGSASIGASGTATGTLIINSGGIWNTGIVTIGNFDSGSGSVIINGGTIMSTGGGSGFTVGVSGSGSITINNGGTFDAPNRVMVLGNSSTGMGFLTLNSGMVNIFSLSVGNGGTGILTVNGGRLTAPIAIGVNGTGSMILNGGQVDSLNASVGVGSGTGVATVNSGTWNVANMLSIGTSPGGIGSVILNGGLVTVGVSTTVGLPDGSSMGTLTVNSLLASLNTIINPNGILNGIGTLSGNVMNDGLVNPGNSPGTLVVNGGYTQTSSGTLLIQLANGASSQLVVGGSANLDGTLQLQFAPDFSLENFSLNADGSVSILTATDGINGTFSTVDTPTLFPFELVYNPNSVDLVFSFDALLDDLLDDPAVGAAGAGGAFGVAGDIFAFFFVFFEIDEEDIAQFFPILNLEVKDLFFNATNTQYNEMTTRLAAIRSGVNTVTLQGLPQEPMTERLSKRESKLCSKRQVLSCAEGEPLRWDIFATASGVFSTMRNVGDLPRINAATGYFSTGADCRLNEYLNVGVYAGYQGMWTWNNKHRNHHNGNSWLQSNGVKWGGYGTAHWKGFYGNAIVGGGAHFLNLNRPINIDILGIHRVARSHPFVGELDVLLGGGYEYRWGSWIFGINNSTQYTYLGISSATESGANGLNTRLNRQNCNSLVYTLGGNISYLWEIAPNYRILPTIGLSWQHEFLNRSQRVYGAFASGAGAPFFFDTVNGARDNAVGVAGITAQIGPRIGAFAYYIPQFGGGLIYSNAGVVGLTCNF